MLSRIFIGILWLIALAALAASLSMPTTLDLNISGVLIPLAKTRVILAIFLLLICPLLVLTVLRFRKP